MKILGVEIGQKELTVDSILGDFNQKIVDLIRVSDIQKEQARAKREEAIAATEAADRAAGESSRAMRAANNLKALVEGELGQPSDVSWPPNAA